MGHLKLTDFGLSKIGLLNITTSLTHPPMPRSSLSGGLSTSSLDSIGCGDYHRSASLADSDADTWGQQNQEMFGTPEYIAPEVIMPTVGYNHMVDWWALGICLYQFIVGCTPFYGNTPEELFQHMLDPMTEIEWPDNEEELYINDSLKDLVHRLLHKDPEQRIGSRNGAIDIKDHALFNTIDFEKILKRKARFIPTFDDEEDTSYFDTRKDRYEDRYESAFEDPEEEFLHHAAKTEESSDTGSCSDMMKSVTFTSDEMYLSKQTLNSSFSSTSARFSEKVYGRSRSRSDLSPTPAGLVDSDLVTPLPSGGSSFSISSPSQLGNSVGPFSPHPSLIAQHSAPISGGLSLSAGKQITITTAPVIRDRVESWSGKMVVPDADVSTNITSTSDPVKEKLTFGKLPKEPRVFSRESETSSDCMCCQLPSTLPNLVAPTRIQHKITIAPLPRKGVIFRDKPPSQLTSTPISAQNELKRGSNDKILPDVIPMQLNPNSNQPLSLLIPHVDTPEPPSKNKIAKTLVKNISGSNLLKQVQISSSPSVKNNSNIAFSSTSSISKPITSSMNLVNSISPINYNMQGVQAANSPTQVVQRPFSPICGSEGYPEIILSRKTGEDYNFGFKFETVPVAQGRSKFTLQHIVSFVLADSDAYKNGLRKGDLITHINDQRVDGFINSSVRVLILKCSILKIKAVPLEKTPISQKQGAYDKKRVRKFLTGTSTHKFDFADTSGHSLIDVSPNIKSRHGSGGRFSLFKSTHHHRKGHHYPLYYHAKHSNLRMQLARSSLKHPHSAKSLSPRVSTSSCSSPPTLEMSTSGDSNVHSSGDSVNSSYGSTPPRPTVLPTVIQPTSTGVTTTVTKKLRRKSTSAMFGPAKNIGIVSPLARTPSPIHNTTPHHRMPSNLLIAHPSIGEHMPQNSPPTSPKSLRKLPTFGTESMYESRNLSKRFISKQYHIRSNTLPEESHDQDWEDCSDDEDIRSKPLQRRSTSALRINSRINEFRSIDDSYDDVFAKRMGSLPSSPRSSTESCQSKRIINMTKKLPMRKPATKKEYARGRSVSSDVYHETF